MKNGFVRSTGRGQYPQCKMSLCSATRKDGGACQHKAKQGFVVCAFHQQALQRRHERRRAEIAFADVLEVLWTNRDPEGARRLFADKYADGHFAQPAWFDLYRERLNDDIELFYYFHPPARQQQPQGELQVLASDTQNVHTPAVNKQTSDMLTLLLNTELPAGQATIEEIFGHWSDKHVKSKHAVRKDMRKWYRTKMCREADDHLYARALDGVWARIKVSPAKDELVERLWEECRESLRMCCEGHISRLCNVFVGFDDAFKSPISVGEQLQIAIAAIAAKDVRTEQKVVEAWTVFEELGISREQRLEWINAF